MSNISDSADYPRPQLRRDEWTDLRGPWAFAFDDDDRGLAEDWIERPDVFDRTIIVPFPPESQASGIGETGYHPVVWYRRTIAITRPPGQHSRPASTS